ncbi:Tau-tubulin kinase 1 [Trichinella zimbabwensis]|uniref:non-specific serine/threonine protein kinase n=1 Tax=Trichinella zimbabwensis TaxID=268475 RepID=A0A0V1I6Q2_9BILA|nr:Tau-tubulin kinase 1 [Trichinella zimbabwensis]
MNFVNWSLSANSSLFRSERNALMIKEKQAKLLATYGSTIGRKWYIQGLCGTGGFGQVYAAINLIDGQKAAVKIEPLTEGRKYNLKREIRVMKAMIGSRHAAEIFEYGVNGKITFVAMQLLGPNLSTLKNNMPKQLFSLETTLLIGNQMIEALRDLHKRHYLHCDVKPSNFVIGRNGDSKIIYLVDYGLCCRYRNSSNDHYPKSKIGCYFRGTAYYASVNVLKGFGCSRRDDIWSMFFSLIDMYAGPLPWYKAKSREEATNMKESFLHLMDLHLKKSLPTFHELLKMIRDLDFDSEPLYEAMIGTIYQLLQVKDCKTAQFDWETSAVTK